MMIVTHDVTERLRIDEMRRDFVANVSHELRTPLTVISGFLDIESQGKVPANVMQKHRELMLDQARRMQSLLDDLLLLSGLENRDETDSDDAEVISMTKLLEDVVNEGRALSLGRHVITLEACRASLVGEPSDIRSAAMNLVSNAVRYTPEGGRIDVRWFRTSSGAVLSVKDTGIGIEEKHIPRLTERFYRVDKGRSRSTGGTGLGLAIVKHVCRSAGGQLKLNQRPAKVRPFRWSSRSRGFLTTKAFEKAAGGSGIGGLQQISAKKNFSRTLRPRSTAAVGYNPKFQSPLCPLLRPCAER